MIQPSTMTLAGMQSAIVVILADAMLAVEMPVVAMPAAAMLVDAIKQLNFLIVQYRVLFISRMHLGCPFVILLVKR